MGSRTLALSTSPYQHWHDHFFDKIEGRNRLPWNDASRLNDFERRIVGRSIQQFQLGEWARGRGFRRRAELHPAFAGDDCFIPSLELFIAEEQHHSDVLGRFLDLERIPRLRQHWLDGIFRRLRKLAGLEACAAVLVTAEVLAMPFYQALRDATGSGLLRSICIQILCDEAAHLNYQALTIGLIRRRLTEKSRARRARYHSLLFRCTAFVVWQQHRRVFRAARWDFRRFWNDASRTFSVLQSRIRRFSVADGGETADDLRLD